MSFKFTKNEFGKRDRIDDDSEDESEEDCSKNIFKYLMFYIFPSSVGDGRRKVLHNLIKKHGGNFTEVVTNHTTHVLVDESVSCGKICRALGWTTFPSHINVVYINWLSDCVRAEYCLKTSDYQVPNNHKPTYVITCANSAASKNSPDTHYVKTKSQSKLKHSKQPRVAEVVEADMSNLDSVEEEESSFDDGIYDDETSCDDEWLYSVPSEVLSMIIPPSFISMDQESKVILSVSNSDKSENTGTLKLRLYRHKSADRGYEYSRYSTVNNFQTVPVSSRNNLSVSNSINEENKHGTIDDMSERSSCDIIKSITPESVLIEQQEVNAELEVAVDNKCADEELSEPITENSTKLCTNIASSSMNVVVSSTKESVETNLNISDPCVDTSFCSAKKMSNNVHSSDYLELKHSSIENEAFNLSSSSKFDSKKESPDPSNLAVSPIVTSSSCNLKNIDENSAERLVITDKSLFPSKCDLSSTNGLNKVNPFSLSEVKEVNDIELDLSCKNIIKPGSMEREILVSKPVNTCDLYETQVSKISSTTENIESTNIFVKQPSPIDSCEPNSMPETTEAITNDSLIPADLLADNSSTVSKVITNVIPKAFNVEVIVKKLTSSHEFKSISACKELKVGDTYDKIHDSDNDTLSLTLSLVSELVNKAADTESIRLAQSQSLESGDIRESDEVNLSENDDINKNIINNDIFLKASLEQIFIDPAELKSNLSQKNLTSASEPREIDVSLNLSSNSNKSPLEPTKDVSLDQKNNIDAHEISGSKSVVFEGSPGLKHDMSSDSTMSKSFKAESDSKPDSFNNNVYSIASKKHFSVCPDSSNSSTQPIVLLNKLDINSEEKMQALNRINDISKINNLSEFSKKKACKSVIKKAVSISESEINVENVQDSKSDPLFKKTEIEMNLSQESDLSFPKKEASAVCSVIVNSLDIQNLCDSSNLVQSSEVALERETSSDVSSSPKLPSPLEAPKPTIVTFDLPAEDSSEKLLEKPIAVEDTSKISIINSLNPYISSISTCVPYSDISKKIDCSTENSVLLQPKIQLTKTSIKPTDTHVALSKDISNAASVSKSCSSTESSGNSPEFKVPLQKGILKSQSPDSVSHSSFNHSICNSILPKKVSADLISAKQLIPVSNHDNSDLELSDQTSTQSNTTSVKPFECTAVLSELPEPMDFATAETNLEATLSNSLSNITDNDFKLQPFVYDPENIMKSPNALNLTNNTPTNDLPLTLTFNSHLSDTIESKFSLAELSDIKIPKPFMSDATNIVSQSDLNSCSKNNDLDILCEEAMEMDSLISDTTNYNKLNSSDKSSSLIADETLIGISALETFNDELKAFDPSLNVVSNLAGNTCPSYQASDPCTTTSIKPLVMTKPSISVSPAPSQENVSVSSTQAHSKKKKPTKLFLETPNSRIIRKLQLLHDSFKRIENKWKMHAYEKAIMAVRKCNRPISTIEDAKALNGIAKKIIEKIIEIVQTGQLTKINEICSKQREATIRLYSKVWGIGSKNAEKLYKEGHRTIRDLKLKANLSRTHLIALRYFTDLKRQIPKSEAEKILTTILKRIFSPFPYVQCDACSSLRRNKLSTGHIDLLITLPEGHENDHKILPEIVAKLHQDGYLIDDLIRHEENGAQTKYAGIFKLKTDGAKHRRLDITVCPKNEQACALLKLTGPTYFNKAIRQIAKKRNMILDEHSLKVKILNHDGTQSEKKLDTPTESAVFQCLGLPYRSPVLRDPDKSK